MVQVINRPSRGAQLGQSVGGSLSQGMQVLLNAKLQGMQQREKLKQLESILGGGGGSYAGESTEEVDISQQGPSGEISNEQILMASQVDPNLAKLLQTQKDSGEKATASKFKETKEVRKEIIEASRAARENDMRLDRMTELNKKDTLINPLFNATLKKAGMDLAALKNADSQEFEKLSTDFLKNAKAIFGARITNFEVEAFLKTIPTLSQSKEGRARVIRNLKLFNEGAKVRFDEMQKVLKENKGVPPYSLEELVEERVGNRLDSISERFKGGEEAEVIESLDLKPAQKGEALTQEMAMEILKKSKGNKDLARKIAKKYGYTF